MTTPGGAGTLCVRTFPSARRIGFSHRVGVSSVYLAPALRSAPPRCPKPSPRPPLCPAAACVRIHKQPPNAPAWACDHTLAGGLAYRGGAMGQGELRLNGV